MEFKMSCFNNNFKPLNGLNSGLNTSNSFGSNMTSGFNSNPLNTNNNLIPGAQSFRPIHANKLMDDLGSVHGSVDSFGNIKDPLGSSFAKIDSFNNVVDPLGSVVGKVCGNRINNLDGSSTGLKIGPF